MMGPEHDEGPSMTRFDSFLAYAESHRVVVCGAAVLQIASIVWLDFILPPKVSVGFLLLFPILFSAAALNGPQIAALAVVCAYLREAFDPSQGPAGLARALLPVVPNPLDWAPGAGGRM